MGRFVYMKITRAFGAFRANQIIKVTESLAADLERDGKAIRVRKNDHMIKPVIESPVEKGVTK